MGTLLGNLDEEKIEGGEISTLGDANLIKGKGLTEDVSFGGRRQITVIEKEKWQAVTEKLNTESAARMERAT